MQENNYLPVNWIDGMKINKTHFIAQDNAMRYQLAQNTNCLLNELNYGLLPVGASGDGLKLFISSDNQNKLQVRIQQCRAITSGGYYIEFNEDTLLQGTNTAVPVASTPATLKELKSRGTDFYIVLSINPYKRVPSGMADLNEVPPRIPFTTPSYSLDLIPSQDVARNVMGPWQLPVGKISIEDQRVMLEEDYIPPCSSVNSHPELLEILAGLEQFYSKMELYSLQIIQKIMQKKQANDMALIVQKLCENISFFTSIQLADLKSVGIIQPPAYLVGRVAILSRQMKNTLDCYLGSGKEELINYFTEWCNISQGELEGAMVNLSNHQYNHLDINHSIDLVSQFTKTISRLFYQLAKLEYIGKRKEAGIFVKEEVVTEISRFGHRKKGAASWQIKKLSIIKKLNAVMQQILNSQERTQAFVKFLVFFLVTVALVILAAFYNYHLPSRENKMLQDEVDVQRQQDANQQKFVNRMQETIVLLDSLESSNTNLEQINLQLNGKIGDLAVLQQKDNTLYGKMNKVIVDRLQELQQKQRQLESLSDKAGKLTSLQTELDKCKTDLAIANAALDGFRKGSPN